MLAQPVGALKRHLAVAADVLLEPRLVLLGFTPLHVLGKPLMAGRGAVWA